MAPFPSLIPPRQTAVPDFFIRHLLQLFADAAATEAAMRPHDERSTYLWAARRSISKPGQPERLRSLRSWPARIQPPLGALRDLDGPPRPPASFQRANN